MGYFVQCYECGEYFNLYGIANWDDKNIDYTNPENLFCDDCFEAKAEELSNPLHEAITEPQGMTDNCKAMALREELEKLGRWGIVIWSDVDIEEELKQLGNPVTPQTVTRVRDYVKGEIEDRMTETGWQFINDAIHNIWESQTKAAKTSAV